MSTPPASNQQIYWNAHFQQHANPNQTFFDWYAQRRLQLFGPRPEGRSLEIGSGGGEFATMARIGVVMDIAEVAVRQARDQAGAEGVVGSAMALPFEDGSFQAVYLIDVVHHLKSDFPLPAIFKEIHRVIAPGGQLYVSDRRPTAYNSALLYANAAGRFVLTRIARGLGRDVRLSGSDDEPPMTTRDWGDIEQNFRVVERRPWKNVTVFWLYALQNVLNVILPATVAFKSAAMLNGCARNAERIVPDFMKTKFCMVLRKAG